jgi:uncharacterized membrane protein
LKIIHTFWKHLKAQTKRHFLTGLLVIVPLGLTVKVVSVIAGYMDLTLAYLPARFHPDTYLPFRIPGLGIIFTLAIIQVVGLLSANLFGRKVVKTYEKVLDRIPFVRGVYVAVKQLLEQILSPQSEDRFRRAVLVEYPRKGIFSIGFVTGVGKSELQKKTPERVLNIFLPTTPNPTSGYYLLIPEKDAIQLDLTVEQAFKLIVSAGMVGNSSSSAEGDGGGAAPVSTDGPAPEG